MRLVSLVILVFSLVLMGIKGRCRHCFEARGWIVVATPWCGQAVKAILVVRRGSNLFLPAIFFGRRLVLIASAIRIIAVLGSLLQRVHYLTIVMVTVRISLLLGFLLVLVSQAEGVSVFPVRASLAARFA